MVEELLLSKNVSVDLGIKESGVTALMIASRKGFIKVTCLLNA